MAETSGVSGLNRLLIDEILNVAKNRDYREELGITKVDNEKVS